jgi:hypothetical protein
MGESGEVKRRSGSIATRTSRTAACMPDHVDDDPLAQVRQLYAEARQAFARDVDALLSELRVFSQSVQSAIGDIGQEDAWRALRRYVLEKFDARLPLRQTPDPVLLQLLREAFEIINDRDSTLDRGDWTKETRKVLRGDRSEGES